jgi:hypothetical protein
VDVAVAVDESESVFILSAAPAGQSYDIYELRTTAGVIGPPRLLQELASPNDEFDPDLHQGGLLLAFETVEAGVSRLFWTSRATLNAPFGTPERVAELQSQADARAPAFAPELDYMMFSAARGGNIDIYELRLEP